METPRKDMDSKVSRSFLRMVLKEMGKPVAEEMNLNSWEMFDLIVKYIHLIRDELKRSEKTTRELARLVDESRQTAFLEPEQRKFERNKAVFEAMEEYYARKY